MLFTSCYQHTVIALNNENEFNITYCKTPEYITTQSRILGAEKIIYSTQIINGVIKTDSIIKPFQFINEYDMTVAKILKDAKSQFGNDITVSNLKWDYINTKRYAVTYDVIRCK